MFTIKQPSTIIFGKYSARDYKIPTDSLVVTSPGAKSRNWLEYVGLTDSYIYDDVEPNPSIETTEQTITANPSINNAIAIQRYQDGSLKYTFDN